MKNLFILLALGILLATPMVFAQAQGNGGGGGGTGPTTISAKIDNPFNCSSVTGSSECTIVDLFSAIVKNVLIPIGSVLAVIFFVLAGFKFVTAQGDPGKITEARNALLYTAIGTAILLGAAVLATVIQNTVNSLHS